ncbi:pyocin knob domain-containing protein [Aminipila luticellarii]|uniref:BppU N-terminal domain-containing protein n=1 Tax=Aminipila luticellarii TaxID=2507160 RepID=A0A410PWU4_9FIRM|nr:pyocin knob domain-containing protein [Aminipila luticellarii]QAT43432.1 hypothetical protein EQM06_09515 [Aminipila luticellarii]
MQEMYKGMVNSPETTITNSISNSDTLIYVLDPTRVPDQLPNLMTLGTGTNAETIKVLSIDGNTLTVERGFQGNPAAWSTGTIIARNFTEYDYRAFKENIEDLEANKATKTEVQETSNKIGILSNLTTTEKSNLVGAITEVNASLSKAIKSMGDLTSTHDLNNFVIPAIYTCTSCINRPSGSTYGIVEILSSGTVYATQIYHDIQFNKTYVRYTADAVNKTWSAWQEIATTKQEDWIAPTLQNGWTNQGTLPCGYYKDSFGVVRLRGRITGGTFANDTTIFTLPVGYRPSCDETHYTFFYNGSSNLLAALNFHADGKIGLWGVSANNFLDLNGITFRAGA